jgi:DNA primase
MFDKPSEEIKQRLNIVDIIQEYTPLKKSGANWKALCPFHSEKTPSFMVSEDKQIFKCFGCGEGGDIFSFVMKIEGIEFPDALRLLAKKAGVVLKRQDAKLQTKRSKLLEILDLASKFYHKALFESKSGEIARDYLKERKVEEITQDEFRLGFAPDSWDALSLFLKRKGFRDDEILGSGLVVRKEISSTSYKPQATSYYDRFRNRLIFPIFDVHGSVIGFGGRVLPGSEKSSEATTAKYINTPQTLIYDKSRVLYGLDKAKTEIRKKKLAVIVEGYMDVIASHQAGIKNVVAASGTALTIFQVELIKRYTDNVVLSFDMDVAGDSATKRGIDQAIEAGLNVKILQLPEGKDPDECIRKDPKIWIKSIDGAFSIMDYYFENTFSNLDLTKVDNKKKAAAILLPQIKIIPNKIEQAHYLQKLAGKLKVDEKILAEVMAGQKTNERGKKKEGDEPTLIKKDENEILGVRLFGLILSYPRFLCYLIKDFNHRYLSPQFAPLYTKLIDYYNKEKENFELSDFLEKLNSEDQKLAFQAKEFLLYFEKDREEKEKQQIVSKSAAQKRFVKTDVFNPEDEIKILISRLKKDFLKNKLEAIKEEMRMAEESRSVERIEKLTQEFSEISQKLNQ